MYESRLLNPAADMPRAEYPRPQWMRSEWLCLNGTWQFAFDFGASGKYRGMVENGDYPLEITVPFCPESKLSGIHYIDFIPAVWYRRKLNVTRPAGKRALLNFGAVDYDCEVWVNGKSCGTHRGGYVSFSVDVTDALVDGENEVIVYAEDDVRSGKQPRGKQCPEYSSHSCSYKRTTGIWQTVWMEFVPEKYLSHAKFIPNAADGVLTGTVTGVNVKTGDKVRLTARYDGRMVGETTATFAGNAAQVALTVSEKHLWFPGAPELYDLTVELLEGGAVLDTVESYFGLRDVALTDRCLTINGQPVFMRTILDQGFNPDGIYTYPTEEYLRGDIEKMIDLGFNGARLHQRIFEERTLYWADRLGYLVWGEFPSAGVNEHESLECLRHILPEWLEEIKRDFNHPALIGWCPLNETYHQWKIDPDTHRLIYRITKETDPTRPVIDASGAIHYDTDMFDVHDYEEDPEVYRKTFEPMLTDPMCAPVPIDKYVGLKPRVHKTMEYKGQPYWVSEYGGIYWNADPRPGEEGGWGYGSSPKTEQDFVDRYVGLTRVLLDHPRICGFCYTQLSDIEQEQNGLFKYDRSKKFNEWVYDRIREANLTVAAIEKEE